MGKWDVRSSPGSKGEHISNRGDIQLGQLQRERLTLRPCRNRLTLASALAVVNEEWNRSYVRADAAQ